MDRKFYEAWFNDSHTVLGRRLHPFCLHDALILSLAESPFLMGTQPDVEYGLEDLQTAVAVCSTPAAKFFNVQFYDRSWLQKLQVAWWSGQCKRMTRGKLAFKGQCQLFVNYYDDYCSGPEMWQDDDAEEGQLRAPWVLAHAIFLHRQTNLKDEAIWTLPLGQVFWIAATVSEQMGSKKSQFMTDEEDEAIRALGLA